jgi:hypothetical protein
MKRTGLPCTPHYFGKKRTGLPCAVIEKIWMKRTGLLWNLSFEVWQDDL